MSAKMMEHAAREKPFYAVRDILANYVRNSPVESICVFLVMVTSGAFESIGVLSLLAVIGIAIDPGQSNPSEITQYIDSFLDLFGIKLTLISALGIVIVAILGKTVFTFAANIFIQWKVVTQARDIRQRLISALAQAEWSYFVRQRAGTFANYIGMETERAVAAIVNSLRFVALMVHGILYFVSSFLVEWRAMLGAIIIGALLFPLLHWTVVAAQRTGAERQQILASLMDRFIDGVTGFKALKAMGRENVLTAELSRYIDKLRWSNLKQSFYQAVLEAVPEPFVVIVTSIILVFLVDYFQLRFEEVTILIMLGYRGINRISSAQGVLQKTASHVNTYNFVGQVARDAESAGGRDTGDKTPTYNDKITLNGVTVTYDETQALQDVSLEIPLSGIILLVGPSGAGKSTIFDLIMGLRQPTLGSITVDDVPLNEISMRDWRDNIGYVPQELRLYYGTVYENISLGDAAVTKEKAFKSLSDAGMKEWIDSLPEGLDTEVGERGQRLSGGQQQRIAIARALAKSPKILLLDEATTALDPLTEAFVCETLNNLGKTLPVFAISHQLPLREIADHIYTLEKGRVVSTEHRTTANSDVDV